MVNRIDFINSISDINYPGMLADFFDQFIALKHIVEDSGKVSVLSSDEKSIMFNIDFKDQSDRDKALANVNVNGGTIFIYNRPISIITSIISDTTLQFVLQ